MALDLYSSCPCGSGKKFKWCCQPIHAEIDQAFAQLDAGQRDSALRTLERVVAAHPSNPEAQGRYAQLLYEVERPEEAEQALEKAFALNPEYPFGYYLRARFRLAEGEIAGGLLLLRKASEVYAPDAHETLSHLFASIVDCEMRFNRPIAARAALETALHFEPASTQLRDGLDSLFGESSALPLLARQQYHLQAPPASATPGQKSAWESALKTTSLGKLREARKTFADLSRADERNAPAWYNLALICAWQGENLDALTALDHYVDVEPDEAKAIAAWALGEVLRLGFGLQSSDADLAQHARMYAVRQPQGLGDVLNGLARDHRLVGINVDQEQQVLTGIVLDAPTMLLAGSTSAAPQRQAAMLVLTGQILRLSGTNKDALLRACQDIEQRAGAALGDHKDMVLPVNFHEVFGEALVFPLGVKDEHEARAILETHAAKHFEDAWVHRPLRALEGHTPADAVGRPKPRRKLLGVLQFLEECGRMHLPTYSFDRLRKQLGLLDGPAQPRPAAAAGPDLNALSGEQLAALVAETLADEQLEQAYQTAVRLDVPEQSGRFLQALVARPPRAEKPDRYTWFNVLIQAALKRNELDAALDWVNEGEKQDCANNEGRRRNDFELRRAQVHARRGEADEAQGVYERLIARAPDELKYRGTAAETMLSSGQAARALRFAEDGLALARKQNNRDEEQHFLELSDAARRRST